MSAAADKKTEVGSLMISSSPLPSPSPPHAYDRGKLTRYHTSPSVAHEVWAIETVGG